MNLHTLATSDLEPWFNAFLPFAHPFPVTRHVEAWNHFYVTRILQKEQPDWLFYMDVDCFLMAPDVIEDLMCEMLRTEKSICGVADGGSIPTRTHNPAFPNPFFLLIHFAPFREAFSVEPPIIDLTKWPAVRDQIQTEPHADVTIPAPCACEPFYSTFHWLTRHGAKYWFLKTREADLGDSATFTIVETPWDRDVAIHSWYARERNSNRIELMSRYAESERAFSGL